MGFDGSAGQSAETRVKQEQLREILGYHMAGTWDGVLSKYRRELWAHHPRYLAWDLYAGPGRYQDGSIGSPLILLEEAGTRGVDIDAGFFERDPETARRLRGVLAEARTHWPLLAGQFHVIVGDHTEMVPQTLARLPERVRHPAFGLVYSDSNGEALNVGLLQQISKPWVLQRLDFLGYISATAYKRRRGASLDGAGYLLDDLKALGKSCIWIREPRGQWQWTFVIASAWDKLPVPKRLGFHRSESPKGREILDYLNLSERERGAVA
jgi:hypothetical protein